MLELARKEGLYPSGPILDFLSKYCRRINKLEFKDYTNFNEQLIYPSYRVDEILRMILNKSPNFKTVAVTGQHQDEDKSRIHPLDIIMFVLG